MRIATIIVSMPLAAAACSTDNSAYERRLRDALDEADVTLVQSTSIAQAELPASEAVTASLRVNDASPVFAVSAFASGAMQRVEIDPVGGAVLAIQDTSGTPLSCEGVPLGEALSIAEAEVGGEAVSAQPDDDGACALEVQVLVGLELWEVKVGADGTVLETEISDEDGSGGED